MGGEAPGQGQEGGKQMLGMANRNYFAPGPMNSSSISFHSLVLIPVPQLLVSPLPYLPY
jgi:hypothetical protein